MAVNISKLNYTVKKGMIMAKDKREDSRTIPIRRPVHDEIRNIETPPEQPSKVAEYDKPPNPPSKQDEKGSKD